jgi:hypothetical protein
LFKEGERPIEVGSLYEKAVGSGFHDEGRHHCHAKSGDGDMIRDACPETVSRVFKVHNHGFTREALQDRWMKILKDIFRQEEFGCCIRRIRAPPGFEILFDALADLRDKGRVYPLHYRFT